MNDTYGHDAGDALIIAVCTIIQKYFRDTAVIGRMGGDEFLVCLRETFEHDHIQQSVSQLLREVERFSIEYNQQIIKDLTRSIGIVDTFGNENFDQLYHYADTAMYQAKVKGKKPVPCLRLCKLVNGRNCACSKFT